MHSARLQPADCQVIPGLFHRTRRLKLPLRVALTVALSVTSGVAGAQAGAGVPPEKPLPVALVDAFNKLAGGPHPGFRANHAKGMLVTGTFTPAKSAPSLSKAPHFATPVPVLVRFSDPTGVPTIPDASPDASPHGMAIRFKLPNGSSTDIVAISVNGFPVSTPQDFLSLLTAIANSGPGAKKPTPVEQFLAAHPTTAKFVSTPLPPPQSLATLAFYGVNAFKFTNAKGVSRFARYQILPEAGEHALSSAEAAKAEPNYLFDDLPKRIQAAPVKYRLVAQLAKEGDPTDDPAAVWPADRPILELGEISLTAVAPDQVKQQKALLYNPLALVPGIEASADPILAARPPAYAVSYSQRAGQ